MPVRTSTSTHEDVRWTIEDEEHLARVVAVVALGQARHAAELISALDPIAPAFNTEQLRDAALSSIVIQPGTQAQVDARRWQRDGLLFEVISWVALIETHSGSQFLVRDPHLGSTTQGLDGLLLELNATRDEVTRTVIIEDKCSERPRRTFQSLVVPAFLDHHSNRRAPDLVATAASLLSRLPDPSRAVQRASAVLDIGRRGYRASLAIETGFDSSPKRHNLFKGYDALTGMIPANREGGAFVVGAELRPWFEQFAARVCHELATTELSDDV
ncbi:hypothetical protein E3T61_13820 [Cryobacterium lactosi]|uniref:DUF1837 domain-containing protein n=1 Tax=Cryobacterium lactosi TaxID=1259202 RepID=A0A4R9BM03_9MICO|nr:hypothetical protein [Cryobacterium lactosi]TFD86948.1 hypothetical protein E3T61_13820 [Cryobacterium lactosi]